MAAIPVRIRGMLVQKDFFSLTGFLFAGISLGKVWSSTGGMSSSY
jgi:hypothetical protein